MAKHLGLLTDVSQAALNRAAREAVAGALASKFPDDPVIGPELSRAVSTVGSVVKRHGGLIELGIAGALIASDRFVVLLHVDLPLTKGAQQLLEAKNSDQDLARINLLADSESDGIVNVDLVVVDPEAGWAGAYQIKRGNGATEHGKRRPTVRNLRASRLVLASHVRKLGYGTVETVTSAVIDYYGGSGFAPEFTLSRDQLDAHFGVPVVATVEAMTAALREELQAELPGLFRQFLDNLPEPDAGNAGLTGGRSEGAATAIDHTAMQATVLRTLTTPPTGPGQRPARHFRKPKPTIGGVPKFRH